MSSPPHSCHPRHILVIPAKAGISSPYKGGSLPLAPAPSSWRPTSRHLAGSSPTPSPRGSAPNTPLIIRVSRAQSPAKKTVGRAFTSFAATLRIFCLATMPSRLDKWSPTQEVARSRRSLATTVLVMHATLSCHAPLDGASPFHTVKKFFLNMKFCIYLRYE